MTMKAPVRVAVTGPAGQIGYSLLFRIASGEMLGRDQPVILQLLEIPPAMKALAGVAMELNDCAFPLLSGIVQTDDPHVGFADADFALLVGSMPRKQGMMRADLLAANGKIFIGQGKALSDAAAPDARILVVGNPANTNALIAYNNAPNIEAQQITAMMRLDHNRAIRQLAAKTDSAVSDIKKMTVWGNHSASQYPDIHHCKVNGDNAVALVDDYRWYVEEFIPTVAERGASIIEARGLSSAASAANAAIDHMRSWYLGTVEGDWVSAAVVSDGSYGVPEGLISSFPCVAVDGRWEIVQGLEINEFSQERIDTTVGELVSERDTVSKLGLI